MRVKKPDYSNETTEERKVRLQMEFVANLYNKNETLMWKRRRKNMQDIIKKELDVINQQIQELMLKREPILNKIHDLREDMITLCVHPMEMLIHKGDHIECKFCDTKLSLPVLDDED